METFIKIMLVIGLLLLFITPNNGAKKMNKKLNEDEALRVLLTYMGWSEKFNDMWDYDITFCPNKECHLFNKCLRNTDRLKDYPYPVSMCGFKPDDNGNCEHYIPQKCKTNKTKGRKNEKHA